MTKQILIAGDPTADDFLLFLPARRKQDGADWQWYEKHLASRKKGGVHLTHDVLASYLASSKDTPIGAIACVFAPLRKIDGKPRMLHSLVELECLGTGDKAGKFIADPGNGGSAEARVARFRGYDLREVTPDTSDSSSTEIDGSGGIEHPIDLVVLNDAGGALAESEHFFAGLGAKLNKDAVILHKRHGRFDSHVSAERFFCDGTVPVPRDRRILHLSAEDLRRAETPLRGRIGWQQSIDDLREAARPGGVVSWMLDIYGAVVVQIGLEAAALITRAGDQCVDCTFVFAPDQVEGSVNEAITGLGFGVMNAFLCALATALVQTAGRDSGLPVGSDVRLALASARDYAHQNFKVTLDDISGAVHLPEPPSLVTTDDGLIERQHILFAGTKPPGNAEEPSGDRLSQAFEIVKTGAAAFSDMPRLAFGNFTAIDDDEMVAYREIRRIIVDYLETPSRTKPLSIAVFGAPGSGKSFGITEMTRDHDVTKLEFNLSEAGADDLPGYFQELRDIRPGGTVPLCFFDEFDRNGYELVARFLAPMQDGKFRHHGRTHPIGRSILVFAGGTAESFEEFVAGSALADNEDRPARIKLLKLPDFASRLDGVLNIKGLNPAADSDGSDSVLRRALLLRAFLKRHAKSTILDADKRALIDDNLLTALLVKADYISGARSLEKVVTMSALAGNGQRFTASDLPSRLMLEPHVRNVDEFLEIARGGNP